MNMNVKQKHTNKGTRKEHTNSSMAFLIATLDTDCKSSNSAVNSISGNFSSIFTFTAG